MICAGRLLQAPSHSWLVLWLADARGCCSLCIMPTSSIFCQLTARACAGLRYGKFLFLQFPFFGQVLAAGTILLF